MHAGTEQLLTIRDGGLVDAGIAQHVEGCAECRDRLYDLRQMRAALRELPQLSPPADAWPKIVSGLEQPAPRRTSWLGGAVAAAALIAVVLYQFGARDNEPDQGGRLATTRPATEQTIDADVARAGDDATDEGQLQQLVAQSRQLEQLLREINSNTPRVMNAGTAGTIAGLQDSIAYIDYGLSYDERLDRARSERLWRQRVGLMNTLVQVRGAQLQQVSN